MTPSAPGFMTCLTSVTTGLSAARTAHPFREIFQVQVTSTGYAEVRAAGRHVAMVVCPEQVPDVMAHLSSVHGYTVTPLHETLWRRLCGLSGWEIVVPQPWLNRRLPARTVPFPESFPHAHPGASREGLGSVSLTPVLVTKTVGGLVLKGVPALQGSDGSLSFTRDVAAVLSALSVARPDLPPARPIWPDEEPGRVIHAPKPLQPQHGPERAVRPLKPNTSPDRHTESPSTLQRLRAALVRWFG